MRIRKFNPVKVWNAARKGDPWLWGVFMFKDSVRPIAAAASFRTILRMRRWSKNGRWRKMHEAQAPGRR